MIHSSYTNAIRYNPYFGQQIKFSATHHDHDHSDCGHDHHDHSNCGHDHHDHSINNHTNPSSESKLSVLSRISNGIKRIGTWFSELFSGLFKDAKKVLKGPDETHDTHNHDHHGHHH